MRSLVQCCQAASPMVCMPASTCRCLISLECVKAWGSTCPERVTGTRIAFAFFLIWPLCSAREQHWRTTIWKRLQSLRVSHTGFRRSCPVSRRTKVSSQPNALFPPMVGSCSRTAVSNSSSRSHLSLPHVRAVVDNSALTSPQAGLPQGCFFASGIQQVVLPHRPQSS